MVEDAVEPLGQPLDQLLRLQRAGQQVAGRQRLHQPLLHDAGGMAPHQRIGADVGIEPPADLVEVQQGLAEHRQLRRQAQAAVGREPGQLEHGAADLHLLDVPVLPHEITDSPPEGRLVEVPGALNQGKTREEVRENVLDALQVVLAPDDDDASVQAGRGEPLDLTVTR